MNNFLGSLLGSAKVYPTSEFPAREPFNIDDDNGYQISYKKQENHNITLNDDVLVAIFTNVPARHLVHSCRLVCKSWCNLIDQEVWKAKLRESPTHRSNLALRSLPWHAIYWIYENPCLDKNLIKNPSGDAKLKKWTIISSGGDGWKVETPPSGAEPPHPHPTCFVTSFHTCCKEQMIDLRKEGAVPPLMDIVQPDIYVSEWYSGRWDCHAVYGLQVQLINDQDEIVSEFETSEKCGGHFGSQWHKVAHTFSKYGPGVRYIKFVHKGNDSQFWAGHYGSKMTGATVRLTVSAPQNVDDD